MLPTRKGRKKEQLEQKLDATISELGELNRALAAQMITLAAQTGDTQPLIQAVDALRSAKTYFSPETCPRENAEVQQALAETLLRLGRKTEDQAALEKARDAFRSAITLASVIGDQTMREELRTSYKKTLSLLGEHKSPSSLFKVA